MPLGSGYTVIVGLYYHWKAEPWLVSIGHLIVVFDFVRQSGLIMLKDINIAKAVCWDDVSIWNDRVCQVCDWNDVNMCRDDPCQLCIVYMLHNQRK